jgi:2',3'-cyclic-nucleotide 2'-phosphodiesterase (5'-nucleotidase family)
VDVNAHLGGAAQLAGKLEELRTGHANSITVAAGDLIGASPLASAWFLDEPTIDALNLGRPGAGRGRQSRVRQGIERAVADAEGRL